LQRYAAWKTYVNPLRFPSHLWTMIVEFVETPLGCGARSQPAMQTGLWRGRPARFTVSCPNFHTWPLALNAYTGGWFPGAFSIRMDWSIFHSFSRGRDIQERLSAFFVEEGLQLEPWNTPVHWTGQRLPSPTTSQGSYLVRWKGWKGTWAKCKGDLSMINWINITCCGSLSSVRRETRRWKKS